MFAILLSGLSIYVSLGLSYNSRMDNLLPQDLPLIKEFNEVVAKTGGSGPLVVVLEGLGQKRAPEAIRKLSNLLAEVEGAQYIDSQVPKEFLNNRQLLMLTRNELTQLESMIGGAIEYTREQLTGFSADGELFNPEKLQAFSENYQLFGEINPYHKGKNQRNYYIFVGLKGTVTDTDFTENFHAQVGSATDSS